MTTEQRVETMLQALRNAEKNIREEFDRVGNEWTCRARTILSALAYLHFSDVRQKLGEENCEVVEGMSFKIEMDLTRLERLGLPVTDKFKEEFFEALNLIYSTLSKDTQPRVR